MKKKNFSLLLLLFGSFIFTKSTAQDTLHITEQLINGTIRIEAFNKDSVSTGTGFFVQFELDSHISIPVIITNRHVIQGYPHIRLYFKEAQNNQPKYGSHLVFTLTNDTLHVINHPNSEIDLVAIPTLGIQQIMKKKGVKYFAVSADENLIPNDSTLKKELKAIENIIMIGYPNGLWDVTNNLPIVRQGTTATMPYLNYNGKNEFLIDIATFNGSSGSPIFYYRDLYTRENYVAAVDPKLYLLGILYAGPTVKTDGKIYKTNPTEIAAMVC